VWAVTGDFSFIAAGPLGLLEARLRNIPVKVVILDNGKASTTGGQEIEEGTLELVLKPYENVVLKSVLTDNGLTDRRMKEMKEARDLRILVIDCRQEIR
jgi:TPP-dependent indolepyruvate ferredoxin oxidoreductase alpha subunit